MEAMSLRRIEPHLFRESLYVFSLIFPFLKINSSQYSVSEHSLRDISSLFIKSALLCAYFASCGTSICCFATRYVFAALKLDICSRCEQSIYFSLRSKFDMLPSATSVDCAFSPRPAGHIERFSAISSRRHIERRISGAYRRRVVV